MVGWKISCALMLTLRRAQIHLGLCWAMANGLQNQEGKPEHPRKLLAIAVRSIQWSYAIFWSISTRQGVLEWSDGYYNGDIKTTKTMQPMELNADQIGLQRSKQLRDLYESLSGSDANQQGRRPSSALSPEDLTDLEWLSGRALANGQPIWLTNAQYADSKLFTRTLLAKTVVCFPYWGGVIELGTTELVLEDDSLIQHIKTSFLEFPKPICSEQSTSSPLNADNDELPVFADLDDETIDTMPLEKLKSVPECEMQPERAPQTFLFSEPPYIPKEEEEFDQDRLKELHGNAHEDLKMGSPNNSLNGRGPNQPTEETFMLEGINGKASQVQCWQFMDEEFSNCVHGSMNSSDCISQTFVNPEKDLSSPCGEKVNNLHQQDLQECHHSKLSSLDLGTDGLHYSRILSSIFKNSHRLISPSFLNGNLESSFTSWKRGGLWGAQKPQIATPQKILKKILFKVASMHGCSLKSRTENSGKDRNWKPEGCDIGMSHVLIERRTEKMDEKFLVLRSLVPSISKAEKARILGDTIEYLKELETRVEELESCRELTEFKARTRGKYPDIVEQTSDNYGNNISNGKKLSIKKRKSCDIDVTELELNRVVPRDGLPADVTVSLIKEVMIEIRCPWREGLLLDIMDAISNLHLDAHSVQSFTTDGILALTIKSKFTGEAVASAGMIKQALQGVISMC
ncbi:hypothetical protein HHK36_001141 [Tetracentron sinense]|uniref:BHLH domain-containing protein n=1 Tax=Tetracentron sinense TaxID=13715 RepID=A0A834ZT73_TETSI|nr:hypothetical protein HHK36_001141 [Tetracentron sinense]